MTSHSRRRLAFLVALTTGFWLAAPSQAALVLAPGAKNRPWRDGVVPYQFATSYRQRPAARLAMQVWARGTGGAVRFVSRRGQGDYVLFRDQPYRPGCAARSSQIGEHGGVQYMTVTPRCHGPRARRLLVHELGHVLGLFHEQSRPDRDRHIKVHQENARKPGQFKVLGSSRARPFGPFDLRSVMEYRPKEGSANGKPVITLADGSLPPRPTGSPTREDFAAVKALAGMRETRPTAGPGPLQSGLSSRSSTDAALLTAISAVAPLAAR